MAGRARAANAKEAKLIAGRPRTRRDFEMFMEGSYRLMRAISGRAFKRKKNFRCGEVKVNVARSLIQVRQKHVRLQNLGR